MSLDGTLYCYRNPLAFDPSTGEKIRNPLVRRDLLSAESGAHVCFFARYFYSTSSDGSTAPVRQFGNWIGIWKMAWA